MTKHRDILRRHADELLSKPGVYAVGIGEKVSNGKRTGKKALICSIAKKKPLAQLTQDEIIANSIEGISTDIIEIGDRPRKFPAWQDKQRPVVPGVSCGHVDVTAGTIGAIVEVDGDIMLLSNNHVFANENDASLGDSILQPGSHDGGNEITDRIGTLYNYVPLTFTTQNEPTPPPGPAPDPTPPPPPPTPEPPPLPEPPEEKSNCAVANFITKVANKVADFFGRGTRLKAVRSSTTKPILVVPQIISNRVDAAVVRIDDNIDYATNYLKFIDGVSGINEMASVGTNVQKLGRTTGYTTGVILQTDVIVDVAYDNGICRFEDQIWIESGQDDSSFSAGGDSGSLILDDNNNAVALLFAGNDTITFANPISNVMEELNITRFIGE